MASRYAPCPLPDIEGEYPRRRMMTDKSHRRVLILVENLPSPFDRRVWQEATALRDAGYTVSIICPTGRGYENRFEAIDGIHIRRYAGCPQRKERGERIAQIRRGQPRRVGRNR